jgi:excisionase family DNA binding protein
MRNSETYIRTGTCGDSTAHSDRLLTINDISEMTGLSVGTLYHWISEKRIPVVRFSSRCVRFRLTDIEQWIAGQVVGSENQTEISQGLHAGKTKSTRARGESA